MGAGRKRNGNGNRFLMIQQVGGKVQLQRRITERPFMWQKKKSKIMKFLANAGGWRKEKAPASITYGRPKKANESQRMNRISSIINVTASRLLMTMSSPLTIPFSFLGHQQVVAAAILRTNRKILSEICVGFPSVPKSDFFPHERRSRRELQHWIYISILLLRQSAQERWMENCCTHGNFSPIFTDTHERLLSVQLRRAQLVDAFVLALTVRNSMHSNDSISISSNFWFLFCTTRFITVAGRKCCSCELLIIVRPSSCKQNA